MGLTAANAAPLAAERVPELGAVEYSLPAAPNLFASPGDYFDQRSMREVAQLVIRPIASPTVSI